MDKWMIVPDISGDGQLMIGYRSATKQLEDERTYSNGKMNIVILEVCKKENNQLLVPYDMSRNFGMICLYRWNISGALPGEGTSIAIE